jgi:predicted acetyltransferase
MYLLMRVTVGPRASRLHRVSLPLRPFTPAELVRAHAALEVAFLSDPDENARDTDLKLLAPERTLGAFDGDDVVATGGWYSLGMTLPGGSTEVAGVTWISVNPTYRRQGVLRALMTRQLDDLHDGGHPVAALWASEPGIYGRFGYGLASWQLSLKAAKGARFLRPVENGGIRLVVGPTGKDLAAVHEAVLPHRPGWFARDDDWWAHRLQDHDRARGGASSLRAVLLDDRGYALYRTRNTWSDGGADGTVQVVELVGVDADAEARLWRFLLDTDLAGTITAWNLPVDTPLLQLVADVRRLQARKADGLWVRLVDLAEALPLRRYAGELDVVVEVADEHCAWNAGRWRLHVADGAMTCERTDREADLSLDVRELGAVYLGGTRLVDLATAGLVAEHTGGAVAAASAAFGWHGRAPHCPEVF